MLCTQSEKVPTNRSLECQMSKKRILVAEDSKALLRLISLFLEAEGYEVLGVSNGQAALDALAEERPCLALLDGIMPLLDGFEVCRHIKKAPSMKDIPVVMLTGQKSSTDFARGREVGADAYITKPFKSAQVIDTIQRFFRNAP